MVTQRHDAQMREAAVVAWFYARLREGGGWVGGRVRPGPKTRSMDWCSMPPRSQCPRCYVIASGVAPVLDGLLRAGLAWPQVTNRPLYSPHEDLVVLIPILRGCFRGPSAGAVLLLAMLQHKTNCAFVPEVSRGGCWGEAGGSR